MPLKNTIAVAALLALAAAAAEGQTVYRCGSSYSQQPCADGKAFDVTDRTSAAEASRASHAAKVDAQRAEALEKARLAQEKNAPKAVVMGAAPEPKPAKDTKEGKKKKAVEDKPFTAVAPAPKK